MSIHLAGLGTAFGFLFSAGLIKSSSLVGATVDSAKDSFAEHASTSKRHGCAVCWHCIFARRPVGRWCSSTPS